MKDKNILAGAEGRRQFQLSQIEAVDAPECVAEGALSDDDSADDSCLGDGGVVAPDSVLVPSWQITYGASADVNFDSGGSSYGNEVNVRVF